MRWIDKFSIRNTAIVAGLVLGIFGSMHSVSAETLEESAKPVTLRAPSPLVLTVQDRSTIAFTVKSHVWALSNRQPALLEAQVLPKMRQKFPSANALMMFLANIHKPVAFAKDIRMDGLTIENGRPVQHVYVRDRRNRQWRASYGFIQAADGTWYIASCRVVAAPGKVI